MIFSEKFQNYIQNLPKKNPVRAFGEKQIIQESGADMKEKETTGLGNNGTGESDSVFPEEDTLDLRNAIIMTPKFTGGKEPAETGSGNMPDMRENTEARPEQEEALPSFGVPNFVRLAASDLYEKTDTGTLLLSETEDGDKSGDADRENMTIDPNATTVRSPLDDTQITGYRTSEKDTGTKDRKENGTFSFDQSTIIAPGGNLDAIRLSDSEEDRPPDFPDIRKDREMLISELAFEQEETEKPKLAEDGSVFNPDAADIFRTRTDLDFDFVRREEESEDRTDLLSDVNAETLVDPQSDQQSLKIMSLGDSDEKILNDSKDKAGLMTDADRSEDQADFLGAAFLTEIPEEADVDPDALTVIVPRAEFEEPGQRENGKTAKVKSENGTVEKDEEQTFDLSHMLQADMLQADMHPETKDESVFDLDAKTVIAPDSAFGNPNAEDEPILELGAEAIIDTEDEIPLELGAETAISQSGEYFDPDAETVVASAADILGLTSGNLLEPPSEADTADRDKEMDELLIRDADEELSDLDSILDISDAEVVSDDREEPESAGKDRNFSPEESLSAMDILNSMGSSEKREEYGGADNTIGLLDRLNAENAGQTVPEDDYFPMREAEAGPARAKKISKSIRTDTESKPDNKEIAKQTPDMSAEMTVKEESEPVYDSLAGKYYFSLSPAQIEATLERIINRIFSERIE